MISLYAQYTVLNSVLSGLCFLFMKDVVDEFLVVAVVQGTCTLIDLLSLSVAPAAKFSFLFLLNPSSRSSMCLFKELF